MSVFLKAIFVVFCLLFTSLSLSLEINYIFMHKDMFIYYNTVQCKKQEGFACRNLGLFYFRGEKSAEITDYSGKPIIINNNSSNNYNYFNNITNDHKDQDYNQDYKYKKAAEYFTKGCEFKDKIACRYIGLFYSEGIVVPQDYSKAAEYFVKGCEFKDKIACRNMGLYSSKGNGVNQDYAKAAEYFAKGCEFEDEISCRNMGLLFSSEDNVIYQDYVHAARYFNKGCWLEDGVSCGLLGKLYYSGEGVFQSYFEAENYFLKGCNLQDGFACRSLGELYYSGESEGLKQNYVEAVKYYSKGCDLNDGVSCGALGLLYYKGLGVAQNYSMAAMYCRKGCELQDGSACGLLGGLYYLGGKEVFHDYDYTKAAEYLAAGCKLQGNIPYDISVLILKNAEYHKDDQIYKYICELKHAPACIYLANLYEQDQRMKQKYYKSAYYYVKGIKLMTHEERIEFFSELLRKNKDMNIRLNDFQQMQLEIEVLRASILENEN